MRTSDRLSSNGSPSAPTTEIESPFLAAMTYAREEPGTEAEEPEEQSEAPLSPSGGLIETPFRIAYHEEEAGGMDDPTAEAMAEFLAEIHDESFEEALAEVANEAAALVENYLANGREDRPPDQAQIERLLEGYFAPLQASTQEMLENAIDRLEGRDLTRMSEGELDRLMEAAPPALAEPNPAFEFFLGGIGKKFVKIAKSAAKGALNVATLGLAGPVLKKIRRLAPVLIRKVLKMAMDKLNLPPELQPVVQKLARRFLKETPDIPGMPVRSPAAEIAYEFDLQVAELLFAQGEMEGELSVAEYEGGANDGLENPVEDLSNARQRFAQSIQELQEGEDPTPAVENFIPAILPALKLGIKIVGRKRVVNLLKKPIAMLIRRLVGKKYTPLLAKSIADAGLRLMNLEVSAEEANLAAGEGVALAVEETMRRMADLPEYVLENEALLEGFVVQAFEAAAAANLPAFFPESVYQRRPDLRESSGPAGAWVLLPRGENSRRYYQKYTRVFQNVPLSPHVVMNVKTFGGRPLAAFLRDSLGVQPQPGLTARVHVYEAVPGTWLSRIARWERGIPGLSGGRQTWRMLHPLTPQAAGLLLGEPALGREMPLDARSDPAAVEPGERFYYLEVPGARPQVSPSNGSPPTLRQSSDLRLELDFARRQVRAYLYLSESDAQEMAVRLRQGTSPGGVMAGLNALLDTTLRDIFTHGLFSKVKVNHRIAVLWPVSGYALKRLPVDVSERFRHQLVEWLGRALAGFFTSRSQAFVTASQDPANGVTMMITLNSPPGMEGIDRLLLGQAAGPVESLFSGSLPEAGVQAVPGFAHG